MKKNYRNMRYLLIALSLVMVACNPSRRAQRHLQKALILDPQISAHDTIIYRDTIITPLEAISDTFFVSETDTIILENESLRTKIIKSYDTLEVYSECFPDTIIIEKSIPIERIKYVQKESGWDSTAKTIAIWLFLGIAILMVLRMIIDRILSK